MGDDVIIKTIRGQFIDINNRADIFKRLENLKENTPPVFGKMTARHMVEHLSLGVKFSNGKLPQKLYFPVEKAQEIKAFVIYTDKELPAGFKAPMLGDEPENLLHPGLEEAIASLQTELNNFDDYFKQYKDAKPINPTMGALDHKEWILFHNKHFSHHFKQFGLI